MLAKAIKHKDEGFDVEFNGEKVYRGGLTIYSTGIVCFFFFLLRVFACFCF